MTSEALTKLLNSYVRAPSEQGLADFYGALLDSQLFLATSDPANPGPTNNVSETPLSFVYSATPDGGEAIVAFTSYDLLCEANLSPWALGIDATYVLEVIVNRNLAGAVINPQGPWLFIPHAIAKLLWTRVLEQLLLQPKPPRPPPN